MPLIVHVIGRSGSGKTTTIEYLTAHLAGLGFRVGVVKHVHKEGLTFDSEGKDTWRHAEAGAIVVAGVAPREFAIFKHRDHETPLGEVMQTLNSESLDVVIVEGFSRATSAKRAPKILTAKNLAELRRVMSLNRGRIVAITGPIASSVDAPGRIPAPIIETRRDGWKLVALVRALMRPKEMERLYRKASKRHGGACVGLAVGIRAAYLASNLLGDQEGKYTVEYGTKRCVAEAFASLFPNVRTVARGSHDRITVQNSKSKVLIQLAPKRPFRNPLSVLKIRDEMLFQSVKGPHAM